SFVRTKGIKLPLRRHEINRVKIQEQSHGQYRYLNQSNRAVLPSCKGAVKQQGREFPGNCD
ncbi:hypothetical protein, partial [Salmonella enterica]|uniref:hypothetical protein n=1 Tax=Salmonella enterica TaxID=28901 RepID=UPI002ADEB7EF